MSLASPSNKMDNLEPVAGLKPQLVPLGTLRDLVIQLDRDPIAFEFHGRNKCSNASLGFERFKVARLAIDGKRERHGFEGISYSLTVPRTGTISERRAGMTGLRNVVDCT